MKKFIFLLCLCFLFFSCNSKKEEVIYFSDSDPLALAPGVNWALVVIPYASYKADISYDSETNGHCRKGDIMQVIATSMDDNHVNWYKFEAGWLSEDSVRIYTNKFRAENAASKLKD